MRKLLFCLLVLFPLHSLADPSPQDTVRILRHHAKPLSLTVEIANTPEARETGLMYRKSLPANGGMLFTFAKAEVIDMWMKNTLIPLDMIFIDERGIITNIVQGVPQSSDTISSSTEVLAVLEMNAGAAKRNHIAVGNKVLYHSIP